MTVKLTRAQEVYRGSAVILGWMGQYESDDGDRIEDLDLSSFTEDELIKIGIEPEVVSGYMLALENFEKARTVMEEQAAFGVVVKELQVDYPDNTRNELQRLARPIVADPVRRAQAVAESRVYDRFAALDEWLDQE